MRSNGGVILFVVYFYRYLRLRRTLDYVQPVPGSREKPWELCTWLMALGLLLGIITFPLAQPWLTLACAAAFVVGLVLALLSTFFGVLRDD